MHPIMSFSKEDICIQIVIGSRHMTSKNKRWGEGEGHNIEGGPEGEIYQLVKLL